MKLKLFNYENNQIHYSVNNDYEHNYKLDNRTGIPNLSLN